MAINNLKVSDLQNIDFTTMVNNIHKDIDTSGATPVLPAKYCAIWPVLRGILIIAKIFTNDETDKKIDAIISIGDVCCAG